MGLEDEIFKDWVKTENILVGSVLLGNNSLKCLVTEGLVMF